MVKTLWVKAIELMGPEVSQAYFERCAALGIKPHPVELVGSYTGFTVEIGAEGLATVKHQFDF